MTSTESHSALPLAMQGRAHPKHVFWTWGVFGNLIVLMILGIATAYGLPPLGVMLAVLGYWFYTGVLIRRNSRQVGWSWPRVLLLSFCAQPLSWLGLFGGMRLLTGWW